MRAAVCKVLGGADGLAVETVPAPSMIARGVRIRVHAAALNFADTLMLKGTYQVKIAPPFVPGVEAAGEVIEVAPGVSRVKPGDRVMAHLDHGAFAEEAVCAEDCVHVIPDAMDFITAAGFPVAYGTSYIGLVDRARLKPGEVLVVHGAAGGVGLSAVEIGKKIGATVIATAGGADKLAVARAHGADHLIDYTTEDVRERLKALTHGRGVDVAFDPVGGAIFEASLRAMAPDGRIVVVGFASGAVPPIAANILLVKNVTVIGYYWGAYRTIRPTDFAAQFEQPFQWWREGALKPHTSHVLPLEKVGEAFTLLRGRKSSGKVVLAIRA